MITVERRWGTDPINCFYARLTIFYGWMNVFTHFAGD